MLFESIGAKSGAPIGGRSAIAMAYIESAEGQSLWCDAERQRELCFIASAAGLSQLRLSDALLCSERSWRLHAELLAASDRALSKPPSLLLSPPVVRFSWGRRGWSYFRRDSSPGGGSVAADAARYRDRLRRSARIPRRGPPSRRWCGLPRR